MDERGREFEGVSVDNIQEADAVDSEAHYLPSHLAQIETLSVTSAVLQHYGGLN